MIGTTRQIQVWAYANPVNMRKSFDGLFAVARLQMGRDPLAGDLFLFVAKNRKQARVLYWDGTGLCIIRQEIGKGKIQCPLGRGQKQTLVPYPQ
jgi:transposase